MKPNSDAQLSAIAGYDYIVLIATYNLLGTNWSRICFPFSDS